MQRDPFAARDDEVAQVCLFLFAGAKVTCVGDQDIGIGKRGGVGERLRDQQRRARLRRPLWLSERDKYQD